MRRTDFTDGRRGTHEYKHYADYVIMNPPFTRHDIRHDQLGAEAEKMVKDREQEIFKNAPVNPDKTSSGIMFLVLGEHLVKKESGTLAFVFPLSGSNAPTTRSIRKFLAKHFHIDTIITAHDPKRFWFSENTNISEMLVIMRRHGKGNETRTPSTRIINLSVNPQTVSEAVNLLRKINTLPTSNPAFQVIPWTRNKIEQGDWSGVQFYSPVLINAFQAIDESKLFPVCNLTEIATIALPVTVRMTFTVSDNPVNSKSRQVCYDHKTKEVTSMLAPLNKYITVRKGKEKESHKMWKKAGLLHLPERIQPNITHVAAIRTESPSIGTSWYSIRPIIGDVETWSSAMCTYFNSSCGVLSLLSTRVQKKLLYPRFSANSIKSLMMPTLSNKQLSILSKTYESLKHDNLGIWKNPNSIRKELDNVVSKTLKVDPNFVTNVRSELSREPMITGRRYGEQPSMKDHWE